MSVANYRKYNQCLERAVKHIFNNLFEDKTIDEVFDLSDFTSHCTVTIEIDGTLKGVLRIQLPAKTIKTLTKKFFPGIKAKDEISKVEDVAGEMGNLIAGTLANQLQFINHSIRLFPPEFGDDLVGLTTFYENINMIFDSRYGSFIVDLFYKDTRPETD
jgi:CheY-specific phosphatase CheX